MVSTSLGGTSQLNLSGKFISTPSQKATISIKAKVKEVIKDSRFTLEHRINKCGSVVRGWRNYHRFCDLSQHNLWSLRYWLWKFIRKQGRYNRYQTNKVIKRAIPAVSWSACKFVIVKGDKSPYDGDASLLVKTRECSLRWDNGTTSQETESQMYRM